MLRQPIESTQWAPIIEHAAALYTHASGRSAVTLGLIKKQTCGILKTSYRLDATQSLHTPRDSFGAIGIGEADATVLTASDACRGTTST
jgi:hypothetical protein